MSGFAGILNLDGRKVGKPAIERLAEGIAYRGPDHLGTITHENLGLAHSLFATREHQANERQPLSLDDQHWFAGDIRLDARHELIAQLIAKGERLDEATVQDSELALRALRLWGAVALPKLLGDYSFAYYNSRTRKLWLVRDLLGVRPLFHGRIGQAMVFGNSFEALVKGTAISREVNREALIDFLAYGHNREATQTGLAAIHRVKLGHVLEVSADGSTREWRHTHFPSLPLRAWRSADDTLAEYRHLLQQAAADRLSHSITAVSLSGGLDSTNIAASLPAGAKVQAYTVGMNNWAKDDEPRLAAEVAAGLGIPHRVFQLALGSPFAELKQHQHLTAMPRITSTTAARTEERRWLAANARVQLSGNGGDELLRYSLLLQDRRPRQFAGSAIAHWRAAPFGSRPPLGLKLALGLLPAGGGAAMEPPPWMNPVDIRPAIKPTAANWAASGAEINTQGRQEPAQWVQTQFYARSFDAEDMGSTGLPLETRYPYLDQRLLRFFVSLPPSPWCPRKQLQRLAFAAQLPAEVCSRRKAPVLYDIPRAWFEQAQPRCPAQVLLHIDAAGSTSLLDQQQWRGAWRELLHNAALQHARGYETLFRPVFAMNWLKQLSISTVERSHE